MYGCVNISLTTNALENIHLDEASFFRMSYLTPVIWMDLFCCILKNSHCINAFAFRGRVSIHFN